MPNIFCQIIISYLITFSVCCHINIKAAFFFFTVTVTRSSPRRRDLAFLFNVPAKSPSLSASRFAIASLFSLLLHPFVLHRLYSSSFAVISFLICETLSSLSLGRSASPPPRRASPPSSLRHRLLPAASLFIYLPFPLLSQTLSPSPICHPHKLTLPPQCPLAVFVTDTFGVCLGVSPAACWERISKNTARGYLTAYA